MIEKGRNLALLATFIISILNANNALAIRGSVDEVTSSDIATSVVKIEGAGKTCSGVLVAPDWVLSIAGCADRWSDRTNPRIRDANIRDRNAKALFVNVDGETVRRILDRVYRLDGAPDKNSIVLFHLRRPAPEWSRPVPLFNGETALGRVEIFGLSDGVRDGGLTIYDGKDWEDRGKFFTLKLTQDPSIATVDDYGGPAFVTVRGQKQLAGVIWHFDDRWRCPGDAMTCRWEFPFTLAAATYNIDDREGHSNPVGSLIEQMINPSATIQDGIYEIRSVHSDKCLDVPHSSRDDSLNIIQFDCTNATNQQWRFERSDDFYKISAVHSEKCLSVHEQSSEDGGKVIQNQCLVQDNERWWLKRVADGVYEIRAKHSAKCLDVPQSSTANEVEIIQYKCTGASNQRWELTFRSVILRRLDIDIPEELVPNR